jgi:hypothetical protein
MDSTKTMGQDTIQKRAFGSTQEAANHYVGLGFSVIPLENKGKRPVVAWSDYQNRVATPEEIHQWFSGTDYNLGIVTGRVSGLSVIDCDNESAVTLARAKGLPDCPTVKTGRGFHFYFKDEEGVGNFQKRDDLPGIDLRGQGGYVVAPPSVHANGIQYEWLRMANGSYLHLPEWAIEDKPKAPILLTTQALEGERNMTLARLAGNWVKSLTLEDSIEQARRWNFNNAPPLPDSEVRRTVESIWKAESRSRANQRLEIATPRDPADDVIVPADLDIQLDQLYESGLERGESPGWATLAEHWTLRKGEWTLVTGIPAHGKSSFLDAVMVNLAKYRDWKWAVFSAENLPHELHISNLAELYIGKPFGEGPHERISQDELEDALEWINDHFRFIAPPDDEETVSRIVETATHLSKTWGVDGMVLDPWNELSQTNRDRLTETEYVSQALKKIRRFASRHNVHALVVAHPMKLQKNSDGTYPVPTPYDVSGSAHFRNKADCAICVWRDESQPGETTVYVQKIRRRFVGSIGEVVLKYDVVTGQFFESSSER